MPAQNFSNKFEKIETWISRVTVIVLFLIAVPVLGNFVTIETTSLAPWIPIQFNGALCMFGIGLARLFSLCGWRRLAMGLGGAVCIFGLLSIIEHLGNQELFIDQIFRKSSHPIYPNHPGRMALSSAIEYTLLGVASILSFSPKQNLHTLRICGVIASFVTALAFAAIICWIFGLQSTANLASLSFTALPTAIGFSFAGLMFFVRATSTLQTVAGSYLVIPLLAKVTVSIVMLTGWQFFVTEEASHLQDAISFRENKVRTTVVDKLDQTSNALSRFGARLEYVGLKNEPYLEIDCKNYLAQIGLLSRMGITDSNFKVTWSYPKEIRAQIDGFSQALAEDRLEAFEVAKKSKSPSLSRTLELKSGDWGNILPIALYKNDKFIGSIYGAVKTSELFKGLLNPKEFSLQVRDAEKVVYDQTGEAESVSEYAQSTRISYGLAKWDLLITPTVEFVSSQTFRYSLLALFAGELFALLCYAMMRILLHSVRQKNLYLESEKSTLTQLNFALESAHIGTWSADLTTGRWKSTNHDEIYGFKKSLGEFTREQFYSRVIPEDVERVRSNLFQANQSGERCEFEFQIRRIDNNELRWVRIICRALHDGKKNPIRLIGIVSDITAEKSREIERRLELEWRQAILNGADRVIISTDTTGVIQTFNRSAEKTLGYTAEEVVGRQTPAIFHDQKEIQERAQVLSQELGREVTPGFESFTAKAELRMAPDEIEWTYIRKDGTRFPMNMSVTPLVAKDGNVLGYIGIGVDLTERKKAEETLRITHDRLRRVLEATGAGIWERDFKTKELTFIDEQARKVYGFQPGEVATYDAVMRLINDDDKPEIARIMESPETINGAMFTTEFRLRDRFDKEAEKWVQVKGRIISKDGLPDKVLSTLSDVTMAVRAKKDLEAALIGAEAATKAKSEFLANMSHEIRTPMNGVMGMANLLLDTTLSEEQTDYVRNVKSSSEALLTIINDILDFSKVEAGKLTIELIDFNLLDLVRDLASIFTISAKSKRLTLELDVPKMDHKVFKGDSGRIRQVLNNLMGNALKFTKAGTVRIRVSLISDDSAQTAFRFEVQDSGIGIPLAAQSKMFQSFSQADSSVARRFGGTGLGLSISKHLVQLMGGEIGLVSEEGKGSTFWFTLTLEKSFVDLKDDRDLDVLPVRAPGAKKFRILVTDDNVINQKLASIQLGKLGFSVDVVGSGSEAIDALRAIDYDLVLMDCQMPDMDGFQATRIIRGSQAAKFTNIPIIALTANALKGDRERCLEAGMNDYLTKPFSKKDLILVLNKWLKLDEKMEDYEEPHVENSADSFDPTMLEGLRRLGNGTDRVIVELTNSLLKTIRPELLKLNVAVDKDDLKTIKAISHKLYGGCVSTAALKLAKLFERLEKGPDETKEAQKKVLHEIDIELRRLEDEFERKFKKAS